MTLRITSLHAEMLDMTSLDGEPRLVISRVLVVATDGHTRLQWFSPVEDAPKIGDVWIGGAPVYDRSVS